jgi:hypothetical protein
VLRSKRRKRDGGYVDTGKGVKCLRTAQDAGFRKNGYFKVQISPGGAFWRNVAYITSLIMRDT